MKKRYLKQLLHYLSVVLFSLMFLAGSLFALPISETEARTFMKRFVSLGEN
jgi:hypothetical protein